MLANRDYHVQHNKYVDHQDVKVYCATNQFPEMQFLGTRNKPHGVCRLGKHYHMRFDPKLGHVRCSIHRIPCACHPFTPRLNQPWDLGIPKQKQPLYQLVKYFTYWHVLVSFKKIEYYSIIT